MILFRALLIIILILPMFGCATNCDNLSAPYNFSYIDNRSPEKIELYEVNPSKVVSGILYAKLNRSKLIVTVAVTNKQLFEQYSAPKINRFRSNDSTLGCTEKVFWKSLPDLTRKIKTGKSEWRDVQKTHRILISGFDKDYEYLIHWDDAEYDLSSFVLNTDFTKTTTIKLTCLDCELQGSEEQNKYKDLKKTVEITADFRAIKENFISAEKFKLIEQNLNDKESLKIRKQDQGLPLEGFKAQCKELGFKAGTTAFGNCVLELNEAK